VEPAIGGSSPASLVGLARLSLPRAKCLSGMERLEFALESTVEHDSSRRRASVGYSPITVRANPRLIRLARFAPRTAIVIFIPVHRSMPGPKYLDQSAATRLNPRFFMAKANSERKSMCRLLCFPGIAAVSFIVLLSGRALRADDRPDQPTPSLSSKQVSDHQPRSMDLLVAMQRKVVATKAEGMNDGRMLLSITNNSREPLRIVLPPGIVARNDTAKFGCIGGMGCGMGMVGGVAGMGSGVGGPIGMMVRPKATPSMAALSMLSRAILCFRGDPSTWDQRPITVGMMMGGMGGIGIGGMGGVGGMGGKSLDLRCVPPTDLPSAVVNPGQTCLLPTRLVCLSRPRIDEGLKFPADGEPLEIVGDVSEVSEDDRVHKGLKRLASETVATSISQLVMWNLAATLDWETIGQLSRAWANDYELALAEHFVERIDALPKWESGTLHFQVEAEGRPGRAIARELSDYLRDKTIIGLHTERGRPDKPLGPSVSCITNLADDIAHVEVYSTDAHAEGWVPLGRFNIRVLIDDEKFDVVRFVDSIADHLLNRFVRAQVLEPYNDRDKVVYPVRIENASPLLLNGFAAVGIFSPPALPPRTLAGISLPPHKSMTITAGAEFVKELGLEQGVRMTAVNLSGL
jgi:hypothetical protein